MRRKCAVRDGLHVEPCEDLDKNSEYGNPPRGKQRGIYQWRYTNLETGEPSRTFFGTKTTEYPKGFAFNFCPFCGVQIDAPLHATNEEDE